MFSAVGVHTFSICTICKMCCTILKSCMNSLQISDLNLTLILTVAKSYSTFCKLRRLTNCMQHLLCFVAVILFTVGVSTVVLFTLFCVMLLLLTAGQLSVWAITRIFYIQVISFLQQTGAGDLVTLISKTLGDFTSWISLSLSPKFRLTES